MAALLSGVVWPNIVTLAGLPAVRPVALTVVLVAPAWRASRLRPVGMPRRE
jgi:hypothetical protein